LRDFRFHLTSLERVSEKRRAVSINDDPATPKVAN
jgi:hypothetical protein